MQWMTYARKATRPATAAKPNDAWMPEAAPVKVLLDGPTGEPVAAGLVEFPEETTEPLVAATPAGLVAAGAVDAAAETVTVL